MTAYVYLLHFDTPYPAGKHPQHYLGVARDAEARLLEHQRGSSKSRLTRACHQRNIGVTMVKVWKFKYPKAAFDKEREIKARKKSYACMCPKCKEAK